MEKITLYKKINYYNKNDFINTETTEKQTFDNLEDALETMKNKKINYVENKKGISAYESLYILHKLNDNKYVKYNKIINTTTKQTEDNIPKEVISNV